MNIKNQNLSKQKDFINDNLDNTYKSFIQNEFSSLLELSSEL